MIVVRLDTNQATAIQLAGERSTLLNDINPGCLWAKLLIWEANN